MLTSSSPSPPTVARTGRSTGSATSPATSPSAARSPPDCRPHPGLYGGRYGLWPLIARIISSLRPASATLDISAAISGAGGFRDDRRAGPREPRRPAGGSRNERHDRRGLGRPEA